MIKSIDMQNFKSYKDCHIDFDPGVNIIIGENDSGKTNIIRAINLVANNKPSGEEYRSLWGGDTKVTLQVDDKKITRFRSDKENSYILQTNNFKEEVFKSFGQSVPELIQKALNMSSINIAFQLEGPFLLGLSNSDVAKYYNNAVHLEIIDTTIRSITKTLRENTSNLKINKDRQQQEEEKLKKYEWLHDAEDKLILLENMQDTICKKQNEINELKKKIADLSLLKKEEDKIKKITKFNKEIIELLKIQTEKVQLKNTYDGLNRQIKQLFSLQQEQIDLNNIVKFHELAKGLITQREVIKVNVKNICSLKKCIADLSLFLEKQKEYKNILKHSGTTTLLLSENDDIEKGIAQYNLLHDASSRLSKLKQDWKTQEDLKNQLQDRFDELMPDLCPLCGK